MKPLAKTAFSKRYRLYGICGAFGLSDHGSGEESDMAQTCMGGKGRGLDGGVAKPNFGREREGIKTRGGRAAERRQTTSPKDWWCL